MLQFVMPAYRLDQMSIGFLQHRKYNFLATRKFLSYAAKKIFRPKGGIFLEVE